MGYNGHYMRQTSKPIVLAVITGLVVLLGSFLWFWPQLWSESTIELPNQLVSNVITQPNLLPSPLSTTTNSVANSPFFDLTIEGIRSTPIADTSITIEKQYQSNSIYTSYLAHYQSQGLRINGLLTVPTGEKPVNGFPAIVFLHGYIPPGQYQTTTRYVDYVDYLARNGFVVFKIDYRGHGDSEGEPGGAYYSSDYVLDTLAAIKALQNYEQVNPQGIGLWGHSMSGNVALRTAVVQPDVKAVVIWGGAVFSYTDFMTYRLNDNSFVRTPGASSSSQRRRQQLFDTEGEVDMEKPFWRAMAPTNYLDVLNASIQLHHAQDDTVVNVKYSQDLTTKLEEANKPHELHVYPSGGHNITGSAFGTAMRRTVDFFTTNLQ
jgi:dipeptidyl aminopeptidase/acylaminoacyl peptidase